MLTGSGHSATKPGATMGTEAEATLIDRLRGGDTAALEGLMEQFAPRVHRLAYGITRNEADAEEVVQDVLLNLFRKIEAFEGRAALGTWICRITVNAALIKRRGKRVELEVLLEDHLPTFREDGHREGDYIPPAYPTRRNRTARAEC